MRFTDLTSSALAWRREARSMQRAGYTLMPAIQPSLHLGYKNQVTDAKPSVDGYHVWVRIEERPEYQNG